jgi:hypothetical protein
MPSADASSGISAHYSALSPFPWHATSLGTEEASRGTRSSRPCRDAGGIKHAPTVDGGLCGCVPARPERTTPGIRCVSLAPPVRSTLPSDIASRPCPCASLVLRLHGHLDRGLAPPSMTACTAHTPKLSGGPYATDTSMRKKPVVWPVRSTAMIMIEASPAASPSGMLAVGKTKGNQQEETSRPFSTPPPPFYGGLDWHARSMYVCVVRQAGAILRPRNMQAAPAPFLQAVAPYRDGLVVAVACLCTWY